eukprot:gene26515-biopygen16725
MPRGCSRPESSWNRS